MKKILFCICTISLFLNFNLYGQESDYFNSKIKGDKCEYNVRKSSTNSIIISNINNSWGTIKSPNVQDYGSALNTQEEYVTIFKIIRNTIPAEVFNKLMESERIPFRKNNNTKIDKQRLEKIQHTNTLVINVIYYPITGKIFEIYFKLVGEQLMNISPDYFFIIEQKIKESGIINKLTVKTEWKLYVQNSYIYYFNDLDSEEFNGEKAVLSKIK